MKSVGQQPRQLSYWEKRQLQSCPLCDGVGFRMVVKQGEARAQKCRCVAKDRIQRLLAQSGIPAIYQGGSLEEFTPKSLEEIMLVDSLRDILNERDPASTFRWVIPRETIDVRKVLAWFATDLIHFQGYSCVWLDKISRCLRPSSSSQSTSPNAGLALASDFLFVEMDTGGRDVSLQRSKQLLESCLRERYHRKKSIFLLATAPESMEESRRLFNDERLAWAVVRDFRVIDPAKTSGRVPNNRWLF
jgi:hypothetical protein